MKAAGSCPACLAEVKVSATVDRPGGAAQTLMVFCHCTGDDLGHMIITGPAPTLVELRSIE